MTVFTVADLLARPGDAEAVVSDSVTWTFRDLAAVADRCAALLSERGVGPGDRVALLLPNSPHCLAWFFGALRAGAVAVIIHTSLTRGQIDHILDDAEVKGLVAGVGTRKRLGFDGAGPYPVLDVLDVDHAAPPAPLPPVIGGQLAALIYTSGSTGKAKGVMVTHANLLAGARIVASYLGLGAGDRTLAALPWSFDAGLNQVLATFWAGGTVVIPRSAAGPDVSRALRRHRVTGLAGVPTLWRLLTPFLTTSLPDLRYITNTGGVFPAADLDRIRAAQSHLAVYLMYGLTEAFRSTYLSPEQIDRRPGSIGRPIPDTEILVLDDDGRPCGPGEVGELVHRGPTVTAGYWRRPGDTARVFRPYPFAPPGAVTEFVVHSGDYVRRDEDGYLYYVGRRDEQFKSRGFRTSPTEVEDVIMAFPLVFETVVFARTGGGTEPEIVAVVVPADPVGFDVGALEDHCRRALAAHQQPTRFHIAQTLPRTSSGKIDRAAVRARAERD
ncbi:AMP-binding protein [Actinoplanes sp. TBRC 11911]|uniref:AMP-binding protein n=1 Tax=Actinoplanes sp. TBRC 11911 TaxID=2729386 RepID=UPI00145FC75F|nr:AMP-binding protein [Actinoplanes sp. TBRC 11911]NMO57726.1 AMP-binding protein [Actinoplanes sp. TBRC 11911]